VTLDEVLDQVRDREGTEIAVVLWLSEFGPAMAGWSTLMVSSPALTIPSRVETAGVISGDEQWGWIGVIEGELLNESEWEAFF
jgi:hypothetical protein